MIPQERINSINTEYEELRKRISDPNEMNDQRGYKKLNRRFSELQEIINVLNQIDKNKTQLEQTKNMIHTEKDQELITLAKEELEEL
jgi:peptide chain release factor 1